jgi:hypothetical protein
MVASSTFSSLSCFWSVSSYLNYLAPSSQQRGGVTLMVQLELVTLVLLEPPCIWYCRRKIDIALSRQWEADGAA